MPIFALIGKELNKSRVIIYNPPTFFMFQEREFLSWLKTGIHVYFKDNIPEIFVPYEINQSLNEMIFIYYMYPGLLQIFKWLLNIYYN